MRLIFLLLIPLAFSLILEYHPIKNRVPVGEEAIYKLVLENNEEKPLSITIRGLGIEEERFFLNPGERIEKEVKIECRAAIPYNSPLYLEYNSKSTVMFLRIFGYERGRKISPNCFVYSEQTGVDEVSISLSCNLDIKKTELFLDGFKVEGGEKFLLGGLRPGRYTAFLRIHLENWTIEREVPIDVREVINVRRSVVKRYGILFSEYEITIENKGNDVYYGGMILEKIGFLITGAKSYGNKAIMYFFVKPGEKKVYKIIFLNRTTILYFIPIVFLFISILLWRPIIVRKEYIYYSKDGKTTVHVFIKIKGFPLGVENIKIIDYIPKYARVKNFETIHPEVKEDILIWNLPRVGRGEEIYLNYNLLLDFEVAEGKIKLPDCYVMIGERKYKVRAKSPKG